MGKTRSQESLEQSCQLVEKWNEEAQDAPTMTSLQPEQDLSWILTSNTVILVDEAQMTYNVAALWNTIFRD